MMDSKLHLYKPASPLERIGHLQQGKLQTGYDHLDLLCPSELEESLEPNEFPKSAEMAAPDQGRLEPSIAFPSGDHTISLSLSEDEDEENFPPKNSRVVLEQRPTSCTINSAAAANDILLVDASNFDGQDAAQSSALKVTSVRVPSPVKVVPHFQNQPFQSEDQWRRFSTNFVNSQPTHPIAVHQELEKPEPVGKPVHQVDKQGLVSSVKRKKGKIVPSRYMSASSKPPQLKSSASVTTRKQIAAKSKLSRPVSKNASVASHDGFKVPTINPRGNRPVSTATESVTATNLSDSGIHDEFFNTPIVGTRGISTSTPYLGGEAPVIHDGSFMNNFPQPSSAGIKSSKKKASSMHGKLPDKGPQMGGEQMEALHSRLIQMAYLEIKSYKALKKQEGDAKEQIYQLWNAVQRKKEENSVLEKMLEEERRNLNTDIALDVQNTGLGPVCSKLPLLEQHYMMMARAIDATRHDIVLRGILKINNVEMEAEFKEMELLMSEVMASIRDILPKVVMFSSSLTAVVEMLEKEYQELNRCCEQLSKLFRIQTTNTSLQLEKFYRNNPAVVELS